MTVVKIAIRPIDHFAGARRTRRTWCAVLVHDDGHEDTCAHTRVGGGHRTTDAARKCGLAMWRAL